MPITVECSDCGKKYAADERSAGQRVKCRNCGNVFTAEPRSTPVPAVAAGQPARATRTARPAPPADPPPPPPDERPPEEPADFDAIMALASAEAAAPGLSPPPPLIAPPAYAPPPPPRQASAFQPAAPAYMAQPRRRKREVAQAGFDNATPWLIILYLGVQIYYLIYGIRQHYASGESGSIGSYFARGLTDLVLFFAVVAPALWLGAFLASKVMKFPLVETAYLKAAGVAAVPAVVFGLIAFWVLDLREVLPLNPVIIVLLLLAMVPIAFLVFKFAFALDLGEAIVGFLFAGPLYLLGQAASIALIVAAGMSGPQGKAHSPMGGPNAQQAGQQPDTSTDPGPSFEEEHRARVAAGMFEGYKNEIAGFAPGPMMPDMSREAMLQRIDATRARIDSSKATLGDANYAELLPLLDQAKEKVSSLPSQMPGPSVFADPAASQVWDTPADSQDVGAEVSYKNFKLRPPADASIDLKSSESDAGGLSWKFRQSWPTKLSIMVVPRGNAAQRQPWVIDHNFMAQENERQRLFEIDVRRMAWHQPGVESDAETGKIHGLTFTRALAIPTDDHSMNRWAEYVALSNNQWLVVTLRSPPNEGRLFGEMQAAAGSIRLAAAGEPHIDPFSPAALVSRLGEEPQEASVLLRRQGASAEAALDEALKNPEPRIAAGAATLLGELATQRSLPALREAAASNDQQVSRPARAALRRLSPKEFDAVAEALLDVQGDSPFVKPKALQVLAGAKPDARRPKIATLLEDMLVSEKAGFDSDAIGKALATWYGENTVNRLLPLLNKRTFGPQRQAIMQVLGATRDKRVALPLMDPWMLDDPDASVSALIALGQPAEDELVKQKAMWHANARVRISAARILEQIGTAKSVPGLERGAHDMRDAGAAAAARQALAAVRARLPKPGTPATKEG